MRLRDEDLEYSFLFRYEMKNICLDLCSSSFFYFEYFVHFVRFLYSLSSYESL